MTPAHEPQRRRAGMLPLAGGLAAVAVVIVAVAVWLGSGDSDSATEQRPAQLADAAPEPPAPADEGPAADAQAPEQETTPEPPRERHRSTDDGGFKPLVERGSAPTGRNSPTAVGRREGSRARRDGDARARAAFIRRGDRVCRRYQRAVDAAVSGGGPGALDQLVQITAEWLDRFASLRTPADDRSAMRSYVASLRQSLRNFARGQSPPPTERGYDIPEKPTKRRLRGDVRNYHRAADTRERAQALARAYGFKVCGASGHVWL